MQNIDIHRTYTLHNFHSGYIWVVIHFDVVDKNGNIMTDNQGGPKVGTKFKMENGKSQTFMNRISMKQCQIKSTIFFLIGI